MKKYIIEIELLEGNDEFWEDINTRESSGCDDVMFLIAREVLNMFPDAGIKLKKFSDD